MSDYFPPLDEMQFVLNAVANMPEIVALPGYEDISPDLIAAILKEAGKLASHVLAPLNRTGDLQGSTYVDGKIQTPEGWKAAYRQFIDGGWNALALNPEYGGQGLPWTLATPLVEMWHSSNMAFALCPMLTQAAVEALEKHGSETLKALYLPKLISGEWTGTMNLTESQAGSDLGAVRTKAIPKDNHYLLTGQKIFITYGDHDLTNNIIHFVLAKTPNAPEGSKGISMFLVPKFLVDEKGNITGPNDVRCVSLEHKLGIHASPTAVLAYGDKEGAIGYLIGQENEGLAHMFTMMNLARHAVGVEGLAISERAYQQAKRYATERVQGKPPGNQTHKAIIAHPDVRRMLMSMKSQIEAMRALSYYWAACFDTALRHPEQEIRRSKLQEAELLTPVVKAWCTETSIEITSLNIQILGGMGYVEETGAAQHFRDARITPIYEGTTGIQASDLVYRKVIRDQGQAAYSFIAGIQQTLTKLNEIAGEEYVCIEKNLKLCHQSLKTATDWLLKNVDKNPQFPAYASFLYTKLFGITAGGWLMAHATIAAKHALAQKTGNPDFYKTKITTALFYSEQILPQTIALEKSITQSTHANAVLLLKPECF